MKAIPWLKFLSVRILLALIVVLTGTSSAPASAGGLAPDLEAKVDRHPNSGEKLRVIVQFSEWGLDHSRFARQAGGRLLRDFPSINGSAFELPTKMVRWLA